MTDANANEQNNLDRICDIYDLGDLLTAVYRDSNYRFGCLDFTEEMEDGTYPEELIDPPDFMRRGWTYHHEIPIVLHPEKGALLLGIVAEGRDAPPELLSEAIEEEHSRLVSQKWKIQNRLETLAYWKDRAIVMGVGVVTGHRVSDELRPANIAATALIDRDGLPGFASHIDALFAHYTTPAARPVSAWGERLIAEITASDSVLGGFVDEDWHIERYDEHHRCFDGLVDRVT